MVIEHTAGKENLLADALSRKHKYSLDPTEVQDFIAQSIDATEDDSNLSNTFINTSNLSISPIPQEITMVSPGCINFKHTDCDNKKWAGHDESLGPPPIVTILMTRMTGTMKITPISSRKNCNQMRIPFPPSPKKSLTCVSSILTPMLLNMINLTVIITSLLPQIIPPQLPTTTIFLPSLRMTSMMPGNTTYSTESNTILTVTTTTTAHMVVHTRMGTDIFPPLDLS